MSRRKSSRRYIEPQDFRDLRRMLLLTRRETAAALDVTPRTVQNWETGGARIPWMAYRMLRILHGCALPGADWEGWTMTGDTLTAPNGRHFTAGELQHIEQIFGMARLWRQAYTRQTARKSHPRCCLPRPQETPCRDSQAAAGSTATHDERTTMKDEHDNSTGELLPQAAGGGVAAVAAMPDAPALAQVEGKHKRLPRQSVYRPPAGAKPEKDGHPLGFGRSVVPVSSVARDMGISPRRVRVMLAEGRLAGQQLENGYWQVFYPYRYILGTRGPALTRQRNPPEKKREFPEHSPAW